MPISFRCVCEKTLKVADKLAGKSVTCPACGTVIAVPELALPDDPGFELVEEPAPVAKLAMARPVSKRVAVVDEDDEHANDVPRKRRRRDDDDDDDDDEVEERPRKRKRTPKKKEHSGWFATENWVLSGGVIGGAVAMLIAIVWFVLGLMNNWLFYYPPILFIVGLIGVIKGLVSRGKDDD